MKKLFGFLIALIVIIVIAGVAAPYFISVDVIKSQAIAKIEEVTGRKLKIEGPISLSIFPVAGISAQQVSLSNPAGFDGNEQFVQLKSLQVKLALMPLLNRNIVVNSFVLDEPKIILRANRAGDKNWEFASKVNSANSAGTESASSMSSSAAAPNIQLSNVAINNGSLTYFDESTKSITKVDGLNLKLTLDSIDSPFLVDGNALWNQKKVSVKAKISTLKTLMAHAKTGLELNVSSDPVNIEAYGSLASEVFLGKISVKSPSLKDVMSWLNPKAKPMATSAALALSVGGDANCSAKACEIKQLLIKLDNLEAKGLFKLVVADKPSVDLDLVTGELDFNPFISPNTHASSSLFISDALANAERWSTEVIDASALKSLNFNSSIKSEGIKFKNIKIGKSELNTRIQGGKLTANIPAMNLYDGNGSFFVSVDSAAAPLSLEMRTVLKAIALEPLMKDAMDMDRIAGKADMEINVAGRGQTQKAIISTLGGNGRFKLSDGAIKNVNLLNMLNNLQGAGAKNGDVTAFSNMSGSFILTNGVINNQDLLMQLTGLNVNGKGEVSLPAYTINYRLMPQVSGRGQDGKSAGGVQVPVLIAGSLDAPSFQPDVAGLIQNAIQDPKALREQLHNTQRSIKDQIRAFKGQKPATATDTANVNAATPSQNKTQRKIDTINQIGGILKGLQGN